mmetsp:Transcript_93/g.199  ORF Transcript_93/g.199 Transcript_93/m.199 type:complete len:89 (+) Transcript_93:668-934(+)
MEASSSADIVEWGLVASVMTPSGASSCGFVGPSRSSSGGEDITAIYNQSKEKAGDYQMLPFWLRNGNQEEIPPFDLSAQQRRTVWTEC